MCCCTALAAAPTLAAASTAAGATADPAHIPLGHRMYTYQPRASGLLASCNARSDVPIAVVNAYGGWFEKSTAPAPVIAVACRTMSKPAAARRFLVNNTNSDPITMLGCAGDSCDSSTYLRCSGSIPANTAAVVTVDADVKWATFLLPDGSEQSECWPKAPGAFPSITLPLHDPKAECAVDPASQGPNPPNPPQPKVVMTAEPFHTHGRPSSNVSSFAAVHGVEHITLVVDGRMDLCKEYDQFNMSSERSCAGAPDPRGLDSEALNAVALSIAKVACAEPVVSGVQIDLEPLADPWKNDTIALIGKLARALIDTDGCKVPGLYPAGRAISTFAFAEDVTDELVAALGPLGYLAISGYDLYAKDDHFTYNSPAEYRKKLERQVNATLALVGPTCRLPWTLGIPVAASTHEYESYKPSAYHCGPACEPLTNPSRMGDYIASAFDLVRNRPDVFAMRKGGCFRGLTMWKFDPITATKTGVGDYPPGSGNFWSPTGPTPHALQVLEEEMGKTFGQEKASYHTGRPYRTRLYDMI